MAHLYQQKLKFGFREISIPQLAAANQEFLSRRSALVTCVDSCTKPALASGWMRLLTTNGINVELVDDFVWIPSIHVMQSFNLPRAFVGFDEVYMVGRKPESAAFISKHFTTDGVTFCDALPDELSVQMQSVMADLYVADGCGLNFAVNPNVEGEFRV